MHCFTVVTCGSKLACLLVYIELMTLTNSDSLLIVQEEGCMGIVPYTAVLFLRSGTSFSDPKLHAKCDI